MSEEEFKEISRNRDELTNSRKSEKKIRRRFLTRAAKARNPVKRKFKDPRKRSEILKHKELCSAVDAVLWDIISSEECLQDIPYQCTPEQLKSKIALEKGEATTVYVKRDGLSTLEIVLSKYPTIANLKRAIELTANLELKEERKKLKRAKRLEEKRKKPSRENNDGDRRQLEKTENMKSSIGAIRYSGDLVCSSSRFGTVQVDCVSWHFLWRAYALCKDEIGAKPFQDSNGRKLLKDIGIVDKSVLKFVKREHYFGRQRQRS